MLWGSPDGADEIIETIDVDFGSKQQHISKQKESQQKT